MLKPKTLVQYVNYGPQCYVSTAVLWFCVTKTSLEWRPVGHFDFQLNGIIISMHFCSLAAPKIVKMAAYTSAGDNDFVKMLLF